MGILETAMNLATSQSGKIAKVLGKPEGQIKSAIQQASKLIPEIMQNPTPEGGARVLNQLGVDKKFLDDAYNRFSPYVSKIPGLNKDMIGNALGAVERAMNGSNARNAPPQNPAKPDSILSKYPKIDR